MEGQNPNVESSDEQQYENENGTLGFQFANIGKDNRKVLKLGKYDPLKRYRSVAYGLNMQGVCRNQSCVAFQKKVWHQKGYGQFSIAEQTDKVKCPMCNQYVSSQTVRSLGYRKCITKVVGKKQGEKTKFEWEDKELQGKFVKFQGYGGNSIKWVYLNITISKL